MRKLTFEELEELLKNPPPEEPDVWTPKCFEPDDLIWLYDFGSETSWLKRLFGRLRANRIIKHMDHCPHCRNLFADVRKFLRVVDENIKKPSEIAK